MDGTKVIDWRKDDSMEIVIEKVSPHTARAWLEGKRDNRSVNAAKVKQYATDMAEGRWRQNAVPIVFNDEGQLMDGQHRLLALVSGGKPIELVVARGVEDDAMVTFDVGLARRLADFLQLRGESYAKDMAALVNYLGRYERYGTFQATINQEGFSIQQALEYFDERAEELRYAMTVGQLTKRHVPLSPALAGALYVIFSVRSESDADDFMERLASGAGLLPTDSILLLRRRLIENRAARDKLSPYVVMALAIKAWNAYRGGRPVQVLSWRPGGKTPEPYPVPE